MGGTGVGLARDVMMILFGMASPALVCDALKNLDGATVSAQRSPAPLPLTAPVWSQPDSFGDPEPGAVGD